MQHIEPNAQVAFKERILMDTLWHIGKVKPENVRPPIRGPFWNYRHTATLDARQTANAPEKMD